jgi:fluoroquinolone resistance protein
VLGSVFSSCSLRPLRVTGGDWSFVSLVDADLRGTVLAGVRLREADLRGADLTGATVSDCDLSAAVLDGSRWSGADLRGSDLAAFDPREVPLDGARIRAEQAVVLAQALGLRIG